MERGRYFNESATENLTQTILEMLYHEEGLVNYKAPWIAYPQYLTTVQKLIETDDDIEWSDFYTAMLLRRYQDGENIEKNTPLFKLVAKVNGGENPATAKRPYYYQIIMNLLDNGFTKEALDFIRTKDMNVFLEKVKKNKVFRSILLNKDETDYKEEIFNAYRGIRDDDEDDSETDEEQAKEARKQEIKKLIKSKVLQRALENTTEKTDTLTITDPGKESKLPNEFLNDNRNWENLHKLLPNLKKLKLE